MSTPDQKPKRRWRRILGWTLGVAGAALTALALVPLITRGDSDATPEIGRAAPPESESGPVLRVLTLNVAHGRGDGPNQLLQRTSTIESNVLRIADVFAREAPDVVALQEADGPSFWSGFYDHVETLAREGGLSLWTRAENVKGLGISFGAALLSDVPLHDRVARTFEPNWPTFSKGFVVSAVEWPGRPGFLVDVVSVHLDFASSQARRGQVGELAAALRERGRPRIVMGDFNCTWSSKEGTVRELVEALSLKAWNPEEDLVTFPSRGTTIDWILISQELEFRSYRILPDVLSDHRGVLAEIAAP